MHFFLTLLTIFVPITLTTTYMAYHRNLKNEILSLRTDGVSYREIQKRLQCSKNTISYHCKKHDMVDTGMKRYPLTKEAKQQIANFCKENTSKVAMKHFGYGLSTIKKYRKFQG
jgi:transposase